MILDLEHFIAQRSASWRELEERLRILEEDALAERSLDDLRRFHYLYVRVAADLAELATFSAERELRSRLELLLARSYGQMHRRQRRALPFSPWKWFTRTFPETFRRHSRAFLLACLVMGLGVFFGGFALKVDPSAREVLMPFSHLLQDPAHPVAEEEKADAEFRKTTVGKRATFSAFLMTHNTRVSLFTIALGITGGIGTIIMVFSNGVMLGAIVVDYVSAGQTPFLIGWLLPHGSVEIPSLLIAGQAGLLLGRALLGYGNRESLSERLRRIGPDLITLTFGVALLLVWAGLIEAFFSQYHQPVLPYWAKIAFGSLQLSLLAAFLFLSGRTPASSCDTKPTT